MTQRPIPLFVNPTAGRGRAAQRVESIRRLLLEAGIDVEEIHSASVGDLEYKVLAAASTGADSVIVAGGDGSVHEAVNGILRCGSQTALGVIPVGTGNDFAKACSIPLDWEQATRQLADRIRANKPPRYIDAGRVNDRYFSNGAGFGFDAKINHIARGNRMPIGDLVYLLAVFQGVRDGVITPEVEMRYDTAVHEGPVTLIEVCNGPSVGGMFRIAPMASNDDGVLDLVFVQPVGRLRIFALLPRLMRGTHIDAPEVSCATVSSVQIRAGEAIPSHLDGEVQPLQSDFEIRILRAALAII
ncbi:MAG: diacylglycerol kinase family lipid kinase [Woeseiaceae bacterium]|nr:diacylglycerol kinase family lipid kinase [Woeseiaceae bacterium]